MISALMVWLIAYLIGGEFYSIFLVGAVGGAVYAVLKVLRSLFPKRKRTRSRKAKKQRKVARSSAPVRSAAQLAKAAPVVKRKPSLLERWREESRRMAEANEVFCEVDDEDEVSAVLPSAWDDEYWSSLPDRIVPIDEDDAASLRAEETALERKAIEKELKRLERVLEGLYTRRDRMLYVYGAMGEDSEWKEAAQAKLEKTKAWRGLDFDIRYTERHVAMLEEDLDALTA